MGNPGKFEANENQTIAEKLEKITLNGFHDNELGDVENFGWYALILNFKEFNFQTIGKSYIVNQDNYGFFTYTEFETENEAQKAWSELENEYEQYESENEENENED